MLFITFQVTVYQCLEGGVIAVLQSYIDEDVNKFELLLCLYFEFFQLKMHFSHTMCYCVWYVYQKDESFYTVSWACNIDGTPFLVAGGLNGIIRVIDTGNEKIYKVVLRDSQMLTFTTDSNVDYERVECRIRKQTQIFYEQI